MSISVSEMGLWNIYHEDNKTMMTSWHGPLWGESPVMGVFTSQKASNRSCDVFLWLVWTSFWKTIELPEIRDVMKLLWCHLNSSLDYMLIVGMISVMLHPKLSSLCKWHCLGAKWYCLNRDMKKSSKWSSKKIWCCDVHMSHMMCLAWSMTVSQHQCGLSLVVKDIYSGSIILIISSILHQPA